MNFLHLPFTKQSNTKLTYSAESHFKVFELDMLLTSGFILVILMNSYESTPFECNEVFEFQTL